jgi:hypothetical protein
MRASVLLKVFRVCSLHYHPLRMFFCASASTFNHLHCRDRATTYKIDGEDVKGIFATDLTLDEVRQLRAKQRVDFRDQSFNGQFAIPTFEEYIDIALGGRWQACRHLPRWAVLCVHGLEDCVL